MAEELCPEYQKLLISSVGQNKMQVGDLTLFCMEKNCKAKPGKFINATAIKRIISLEQGK